MKIKVDIRAVVDKILGGIYFDKYESKFVFLSGQNICAFVSGENKIKMPRWKWEWIIEQYLLKTGFDEPVGESSLKILSKEKPNDDNGFNNTTVLVEINGWTIPGIKFMENK